MDDEFRFDPVNEDKAFNTMALIEQTGHATYLARERELRQYNISSRWAAVLLVVWAMNNNATPGDISRWLLREPHSITGLLDRMEREGYLHRYQDRHRRNVVRVAMTEKGRDAYQQSLRRESYHKMAAAITEEERRELCRILAKVWKVALTEIQGEGGWAEMAASHLSDAVTGQLSSEPPPNSRKRRSRANNKSGIVQGK